jgi:hypothetical protein
MCHKQLFPSAAPKTRGKGKAKAKMEEQGGEQAIDVLVSTLHIYADV